MQRRANIAAFDRIVARGNARRAGIRLPPPQITDPITDEPWRDITTPDAFFEARQAKQQDRRDRRADAKAIENAIDAFERAEAEYWAKPHVVYYVRFCDRIKIGTSWRLYERLKEIPHDELLAAEPGERVLESMRHDQFKSCKAQIVGGREWFDSTPILLNHVQWVRHKYGDPFVLANRVVSLPRGV